MTDIRKPTILERAAPITEKEAASDVRTTFIAVREDFIANTGLSYQDGLFRWIAALRDPSLVEYSDLNKEVQFAVAKADAAAIKAALDEALTGK